MTDFKCNRCGSDLHAEDGRTTVMCSACHTTCAVPSKESQNEDIDRYIKQAYSYLDDSIFSSAEEVIGKALELDMEHAEACFVKLLVHRRVRSAEELVRAPYYFEEEPFFKRALRYANETYRAELQELAKQWKYNRLKACMSEQESLANYHIIFRILSELAGYRDCEQLHAEQQTRYDAYLARRAKTKKKIVITSVVSSVGALVISVAIFLILFLTAPYREMKQREKEFLASYPEAMIGYSEDYPYLELKEENSEYKIVGVSKDACPETLVIPDMIDGVKMCHIGEEAFRGVINMKKVTIPVGIYAIEENAFADCTGLESLTIKGNHVKISNGAFAGCSSLSSLTMGVPQNGIDYGIGHIFGNAVYEGGTEVVGDGIWYVPATLKHVTLTGNGFVYGNMFKNWTMLESVIMEKGIERIFKNAFYGCRNLKTVVIPNTVTFIQEYAFAESTKLKEIVFKGTKTEWDAIEKIRPWGSSTLQKIIFEP